MAEYKLSYTAAEIDEKIGKVGQLSTDVSGLQRNTVSLQNNVSSLQTDIQTKAEIVTLTTSEYEELETQGSTNANALYMLTDSEENNFIQVSDTMPTDEEVEIWINTSEEYDDSNSGGGNVNLTAESIADALGYTPANEAELSKKANSSELGSLAKKSTVEKTDLSSSVQTSLNKADSALQSYTETDPTVPSWAKASTKPSYTKSEVGLGNVDNVKQYSASNPPPYPVSSVNGKIGAVSLTASDVGARASTWMPTAANVGADASGTASSTMSAHNSSTSAHADIREAIQNLSNEKVDQSDIVQGPGESESQVMSQKAVTDLVSDALDNVGGNVEYETVDSVEEMTDTSKGYVLSTTGTIWVYGEVTTETEPPNKFVPSTATLNARLSGSSASVTANASAGSFVSDFIPVANMDSITPFNVRLNWEMVQSDDDKVLYFNSSKTRLESSVIASNYIPYTIANGGTLFDLKSGPNTPSWADVAYVRFQLFVKPPGTSLTSGDVENLTITFDHEGGTKTENAWYDTGLSASVAGDGGNYIKLAVQVNQNSSDIYEMRQRVTLLESDISSGATNGATISVPDYWKEYVDSKSATVKELQSPGISAFQFVWFSDMHGANGLNNAGYSQPNAGTSRTLNLGKVAQYITEKYDVPLVAISGDVMSQASHNTEQAVWDEYTAIHNILSPIDPEKLMMVKGNHDGSWCTASVNGTNVSYLKNIGTKQIYNALYRKQAEDRHRVFGPDGTYFYIDMPQHIRFYMLNSQTDGDGSVDENGYANYNAQKNAIFGQTQIDWFANSLNTVPEGWEIIVMAHTQLTLGADGPIVSGIMDAYNNRTIFSKNVSISSNYWGTNVTDNTYKTVSASVDFSNAKGEIIAYFHGHNHTDNVDTSSYTFPRIVITTSGGDVRDSNPVTRVPGTATETVLDLVTIDRDAKIIYCTRFGAGNDRIIPYGNGVVSTYNITNNLSYCINSNNSNQIVAGKSYSATIIPNDQYVLDGVSVLMGGVDITTTAYTNGIITIASVTGDIVITALASPNKTDDEGDSGLQAYGAIATSIDTDGSIYNQVGYKDYTRINSSGEAVSCDSTECFVTGFIPMKAGDTFTVNGNYILTTHEQQGSMNVAFYDANFNKLVAANMSSSYAGDRAFTDIVTNSDGYVVQATVNQNWSYIDMSAVAYVRFTFIGTGAGSSMTVFNSGDNGSTTPPVNENNEISKSTDIDGSIYNGTGYKLSTRINSSGNVVATNTTGTNPIFTTGFIPIKPNSTVRMENCWFDSTATTETMYGTTSGGANIGWYNASKTKLGVNSWLNFTDGFSNAILTNVVVNENDYCIQFDVLDHFPDLAFVRFTLTGDSTKASITIIHNEQDKPDTSNGVVLTWKLGYTCSYTAGESWSESASSGYDITEPVQVEPNTNYIMVVTNPEGIANGSARVIGATDDGIVTQVYGTWATGEHEFTTDATTTQIRLRAYSNVYASQLVWTLIKND